MPNTSMDRWAIAGVLATILGTGLTAYFSLFATDAVSDPSSIDCNSTFLQSGNGNIVQNCGASDVGIKGGSHGYQIGCNSDFQQDGNGNLIQYCGNGTIIVGLTQEKFFEELRRREEQLHSNLTRASEAEKELLSRELLEVRGKLNDLDAAYRRNVEELRQLRLRIEDFEAQIPRDKLEAAQQALFKGDRAKTDALLAEVEQAARGQKKIVAEAAFARAEIARQEVRWNDAADHYKRAALLDPSYETLIRASDLLWLGGWYREAIKFEEDLVNLSMAENGAEDARTAVALNNLAESYTATGQYAEAELLYREALEITRNLLGEAHPDYAFRLNNLAELLRATGRYEEAEPLYREALEIDRKVLGEAHPDYAIDLNNLAGLLWATGRYEDAEPLFREALAVIEAALGADHPNTKVVRENLQIFLSEQGRE